MLRITLPRAMNSGLYKAEITPTSFSAPGFQCGNNIAIARTGQHGALQHHKVVRVFVSKRIPNGLTGFEDVAERVATVGIARCGNADKRASDLATAKALSVVAVSVRGTNGRDPQFLVLGSVARRGYSYLQSAG